MPLNEKERKRLIVEQSKNIQNYCWQHPECTGCIFLNEDDIKHSSNICILQWSDPEHWKLPELD